MVSSSERVKTNPFFEGFHPFIQMVSANHMSLKESRPTRNHFFSDNVSSVKHSWTKIEVWELSFFSKITTSVHVRKSCRNLFEGIFFHSGNRMPLWWCLIGWWQKFYFWGHKPSPRILEIEISEISPFFLIFLSTKSGKKSSWQTKTKICS